MSEAPEAGGTSRFPQTPSTGPLTRTGGYAAGFHGRAGFGQHPALVVVDVNLGFTDPASPLVCELDDVVAAIARLLGGARRAGIPVVYTTVAYDAEGKRTAAAFIDKVPALLTLAAGSRWVEIDPRIAPRGEEPVLTKLFASAFFGTPLASLLAEAGCDSLIVTGASTSGCIRATVVDALQHGYRAIVPREAVGDRNLAAHEANLYDIDAKYGDVVSLDDVLGHLRTLTGAEVAERIAP
jgi:nicotinamidase-related amidase